MMFLLILLALLFSGCATTGQPGGMAPLSPLETNSLAHTAMAIGLEVAKANDYDQLRDVQSMLEDTRAALMMTLAENPTQLPSVGNSFVAGLNPVYQAGIRSVMSILLIRAGPLIDKGQTEFAAVHIEAGLSGAIQAIADRKAYIDSVSSTRNPGFPQTAEGY